MSTQNSVPLSELVAAWWIPLLVAATAVGAVLWVSWQAARAVSADAVVPALVLTAGVLVAILLVASLVLWRHSVHQARQLAAPNAELEQQRERFELAVAGSQNGLWDWETATDEVWYAPQFRELLGYDGEDTESMPPVLDSFNQRLHPEDMDPTWEKVNRHLAEGVPYDTEYRLRTEAGDYRWFRARGASVRDASGKATRMAGSVQDITDHKIAEQRLLETAEELRRRNSELEQFASIA